MTTTSQATSLLPIERKPALRQRVLAGLYWHEWFAHGSQMLFVLSAWLIGQWILQVFLHPGWVIGWGCLMALWLGLVFAGGDALEGIEEFSLALPPMRGQRYVARLVVSLPFLLGLIGVSLLAIGLDWPQWVWGLLVETGFTRSLPHEDIDSYFYALAVACPLCAYGVTFGFAAMATSRDQVTLGVLFGVGYTVAGLVVGAAVEGWWFDGTNHKMTMGVAFVVLMFLAGLLLMMGYNGYKRKDGISRPKGTASPEWREALIVTGGLVLLAILAVIVTAYVEMSRSH